MGSYYLKPLAALADERPVIFYDQLGAGHSDYPADTSQWNLARSLQELARVRQALGLTSFHLYGHSWGGRLAAEYLLTHPGGVRSVILAGAGFSPSRTLHDRDSLRATLPESIRSTLMRHEEAGTCGSQEYAGAMLEFYRRFFARRQPWSADLDSTVASAARSRAVYRRMGGPPCAPPEGFAAAVDRTGRLREITVPALFAVGMHDVVTPATARFYQSLVPGAELAVFDSSGHLPMHDQPERYVTVIRRFLRTVEARL